MKSSGVYGGLLDVLGDAKFPEVDCRLRQGCHIGHEDLGSYTFLVEAQEFLNQYYRKYSCQLLRSTDLVGEFFYLNSYGTLLGQRKLSVQTMKVGIALGYMVSDPEYIDKRIPLDRLVTTLKMLLGEDRYLSDFAPRSRGRNTDRDEVTALKAVETAVRQLGDLGFVTTTRRGDKVISALSPIYRFLDPIRGIGRLEDALEKLIKQGVIDDDLSEDQEEEMEDEEGDL